MSDRGVPRRSWACFDRAVGGIDGDEERPLAGEEPPVAPEPQAARPSRQEHLDAAWLRWREGRDPDPDAYAFDDPPVDPKRGGESSTG